MLGDIVRPSSAATDICRHRLAQRAEKKAFSDAEIVDGFLKTAIGAEYHITGWVDRIRKYDRPVRVFPPRQPRRSRGAIGDG